MVRLADGDADGEGEKAESFDGIGRLDATAPFSLAFAMQKFIKHASIALVLLAAMTGSAHAHPGHDVSSLLNGLAHPLSGLDHLLAMIAVGLWAAQLGGRERWLVPAGFVGVLTLGGALGLSGVALPFAESGAAASVLILGVLIAVAVRLPLAASVAVVGVFALCHGFAHGAEMSATTSAAAYGAGFVLASAMLHLAGILLALAAAQKNSRRAIPVLRLAGAALAVAGLVIWAV